jgi:hypothetical protein
MSTNGNSNFSRADWHLVYIRLNRENLPLRLAIRIESQGMEKDMAIWFSVDHESGTSNTQGPNTTAACVVHELGWFRDVALFTQICENHTVPAGLAQGNAFQLWISGLLPHLATNYPGSWILNDGCS